jgi:hypothetical protein
MVGSVTGCMYGRNRRIACNNRVAVGNGRPRDTPPAVTLRPRHLEKLRAWHPLRNRGSARHVIGVSVGDDDLHELVALQRGGKGVKMARISNAGINERRHSPANQPRPVTFTRHLSGIEGVHRYWLH